MLNSIVSEFSIFAENLQFPFVEGGSGSDTFRRSRRGDMSLLGSCVFGFLGGRATFEQLCF